MSYAIKKAGVAFKIKLGTNADLTGQADNFSAYYIKDSDGTKTDITAKFTEDTNTAGLYMVDATIPTAGDYTIVITNDTIGMGNHEAPIVVVNATIDDVKTVVDDLTTTLSTVAADVDGLNGQDLSDIKATLANIKTLLDDGDGSTVNSVMEFVAQINDALADSGSGLQALSGFTDDIENMLNGTQYLADGTTDNPFYDADHPGVAKESTLTNALATLQGNITDAQTALNNALADAKSALSDKADAVQAVVDANKTYLEDAGYGLSALKDLIDGVANDVASSETNITDILNDATNGLSAIKDEITTRFDNVDSKLVDIENKVDAGSSKTEFRVFA